jgi:hypothetical protein
VKLNLNQQQVPIINSYNTFKNPAYGGIFYLKPFVTLLLLFATATCFSQPKLEVTGAKKNFGFVTRGTVVKNEYDIINTGNQPLIITDAEVSCSCTTVDFPKQPVLPNQKAVIIISFNTTTVYGRQDRVVYINSNGQKSPVKLRYKGIVSNK